MHVFAEYSLLAMFDTYPTSKSTTQNMYMCVCAGSVVIVSLRTALGSLKEEAEDELLAWATISLYHFRNVCQLLLSSSSENRLWSFIDGWNFEKRWNSEHLQRLLESCHLDLRRQTSDYSDFNGLLASACAPKKLAWLKSGTNSRRQRYTR